MMPYRKRYQSTVPIELGVDHDTARWLVRESFEKKITADGLNVVEYSERPVPVEEIPPKVMEQLGRPLTDFDWFEFSAVGELNQELFDWLSAECAWRTQQTREWLAAERAYLIRSAYAQRKADHAGSV